MAEMKEYEKPIMDVIVLSGEDVVCASNPDSADTEAPAPTSAGDVSTLG